MIWWKRCKRVCLVVSMRKKHWVQPQVELLPLLSSKPDGNGNRIQQVQTSYFENLRISRTAEQALMVLHDEHHVKLFVSNEQQTSFILPSSLLSHSPLSSSFPMFWQSISQLIIFDLCCPFLLVCSLLITVLQQLLQHAPLTISPLSAIMPCQSFLTSTVLHYQPKMWAYQSYFDNSRLLHLYLRSHGPCCQLIIDTFFSWKAPILCVQ